MNEYTMLAAFVVGAALILAWRYLLPKRLPKGIITADHFTFPTTPAKSVHGIRQQTDSLVGKKRIVLRYRIDGAATFRPQEAPGSAALISLMIERKGNDYTVEGKQQLYRLYSRNALPVVSGAHTLTVDLTPDSFGGVLGNVVTKAALDDVLENAAAIHVCFGQSSGREHGVYAVGEARFALLGLDLS